MTVRLVFAVLLSASAGFLADSAPTSFKSAGGDALTAAESPLVRTKRAEEILYGNHQNAPRVKKSDPSSATVDDDDSAKSGDVIKDDALSTTIDENAVNENENREDSNEQHESQEEETGEHSMEDVPPEVDATEPEAIRDYDEGERKKRSIQSAAMMTAENMMDSGSSSSSRVRASSLTNRPVRAKRDLDYKDLRQLLEESRERPYYDTIPERAYRAEEDDGREMEEEEEEEPEREGEMPLPYGYGAGYERPSAKDELLRELVERKVEEDAREKLLDYLLAAAIASEAESTEGRSDVAEGDVLETPMREDYEDDDGDEDGPRELIGVPPPLAKRNDFYPYSYEPYGGRWGALVPGSKRSSNEYERLYRLAQALNADEDYEDE